WLIVGQRQRSQITRPVRQLLRRGVDLVVGEAGEVDASQRLVRIGSEMIAYDLLVLASGAEMSFDSIPGLAAAQTFYTLDAADRLGAALRYFSAGRVVIAVAGTPYKGPGAPYEAAMLLEHYFHTRRMRQNVEIELVTPEERPLAYAGVAAGDLVLDLLAHKGIGFHGERHLATVNATRHEIVFSNGETGTFQLLIAIPEHRAPEVVVEAGLTDATGWIPVNRRTLETDYEDVYAIGDVTRYGLPDGTDLPMAGIFAEAQAIVVAKRIAHRINGGAAPGPFVPKGRGFVEVGGGAALMYDGDYAAVPRQINLKQPSIAWHVAKKALERYWLWRWY
ncbi:MAG TPA: FAD-dependent oxidoreductase, partial [Dehalococcoidia bacterium]|nr:FAD-dependent oxidoreductase [Dehalococcoidia bacterium]